jgi:hypothetical protein
MGDSGDKQTLTNADFRKILFTPRPGTKPDLAQQAKEQRKEQNLQNKAKPRPKPKQQAGKGNKAEASDEEDGPGYRDRAAERRKGLGIEHIVDDDDAAAFPVAAAPNVGHLTYEETKYLGGDVDHTHLVKGLDYALLSKIRSEQMQQGGKSGGGDADGAPQPVSFSGPLGRAVYNILIKSQQHQADIVHEDISERFLPRRTAFVFNIDEAGMKDIFQVPTTLLRAKEDCPAPPKIAEASSDAVVLDRLSKIMAYMAMGSGNSGGSSKTKLKKQRKQELLLEAGFIQPMLSKKKIVVENEEKEAELDTKLQVNKPVDEEEDIFADAGTDYVAERRMKKPTDEAGEIKLQKEAVTADEATKKRGKYFGSDAPTSLEGADLPPIAKAMPGSGVDQAEEERKAKAREARHREMLASVGATDDDGYAECYPSYYDAAGAVYDSEDDDGTGMTKAKTVDEAEEGGDGGDGGNGGKDKGMAARKEAARLAMKERQKEEAELNKLQKVFEEKGYGNAGAFGAKDGDKGGAAGEAPPGAVPPMPTAKRRRI